MFYIAVFSIFRVMVVVLKNDIYRNSPVPVKSTHKGQWGGALIFCCCCFFIWARINDWVNNWWGWWFETPSWSLWRQCNGRCCDRQLSLFETICNSLPYLLCPHKVCERSQSITTFGVKSYLFENRDWAYHRPRSSSSNSWTGLQKLISSHKLQINTRGYSCGIITGLCFNKIKVCG